MQFREHSGAGTVDVLVCAMVTTCWRCTSVSGVARGGRARIRSCSARAAFAAIFTKWTGGLGLLLLLVLLAPRRSPYPLLSPERTRRSARTVRRALAHRRGRHAAVPRRAGRLGAAASAAGTRTRSKSTSRCVRFRRCSRPTPNVVYRGGDAAFAPGWFSCGSGTATTSRRRCGRLHAVPVRLPCRVARDLVRPRDAAGAPRATARSGSTGPRTISATSSGSCPCWPCPRASAPPGSGGRGRSSSGRTPSRLGGGLFLLLAGGGLLKDAQSRIAAMLAANGRSGARRSDARHDRDKVALFYPLLDMDYRFVSASRRAPMPRMCSSPIRSSASSSAAPTR